jgi:restriction endonuclease Mrr
MAGLIQCIEECMTSAIKAHHEWAIATLNNEPSQFYMIECKRYKSSHKVGVKLIREQYGVKVDRSADEAVLVTTSNFTNEARNFAKRHYMQLQLKDFNDVMDWIRKYINDSTTLQFNKSLLQNKVS